MYCHNCGVSLDKDTKFCHNCGGKADADPSIVPIKPIENILYSKEWYLKNFFAFSSLPKVDILINKDTLYLIKLPHYRGNVTGGVIGFLLASILGALIGASIGESNDRKKRERYRSAWVDSHNNLISQKYQGSIYSQIPLYTLRNNISLGKNSILLKINGKKIKLGRRYRSFQTPDRTEYNLISQKLKQYVL
ncbi:MAG: hypothetical protein V4665_03130 [Patescibacteria group bacterium]